MLTATEVRDAVLYRNPEAQRKIEAIGQLQRKFLKDLTVEPPKQSPPKAK